MEIRLKYRKYNIMAGENKAKSASKFSDFSRTCYSVPATYYVDDAEASI